jgi:hypothetical protein
MDLRSQLVGEMRASISRQELELQAKFSELNKSETRTIPEDLFLQHFMPIFDGSSIEDKDQKMAIWLTIAGSGYARVIVVDINKRPVAVVPPIFNREMVNVEAKTGINLGAMFEEANRRSDITPVLGAAIIRNELGSVLTKIIESDSNSAIEKEWIALFEKYPNKLLVKKAITYDSGESELDL